MVTLFISVIVVHVGLLFGCHSYLIVIGLTTWEHMAHSRISYLKIFKEGVNTFHEGYFKNVCTFLCHCRVRKWEKVFRRSSINLGVWDQCDCHFQNLANSDSPNKWWSTSLSEVFIYIYNMSGRCTRAEGESLYIRYNTDANVVNGLKNDSSYEFIGKVISKNKRCLKADFQSSHEAPRSSLPAHCECLHLIKINCLALWLDESAHACTRSELRGASCEDWKSAFKPRKSKLKFM
jgi:hypothetical protein